MGRVRDGRGCTHGFFKASLVVCAADRHTAQHGATGHTGLKSPGASPQRGLRPPLTARVARRRRHTSPISPHPDAVAPCRRPRNQAKGILRRLPAPRGGCAPPPPPQQQRRFRVRGGEDERDNWNIDNGCVVRACRCVLCVHVACQLPAQVCVCMCVCVCVCVRVRVSRALAPPKSEEARPGRIPGSSEA